MVWIKDRNSEGKAPDFRIDKDGVLWFKKRLCVPKQGHFCRTILDEAHNSTYSIHPGTTKMYLDLKEKYWWNGIVAVPPELIRLKCANHHPKGNSG